MCRQSFDRAGFVGFVCFTTKPGAECRASGMRHRGALEPEAGCWVPCSPEDVTPLSSDNFERIPRKTT